MCLGLTEHNAELINNIINTNINVIIIAITTTTLSKTYSLYYMSYSKCIHNLPHGNVTTLYEVSHHIFPFYIWENCDTERSKVPS